MSIIIENNHFEYKEKGFCGVNNKIIAKRLIALRGEKTREEVAEAVGVTRTSIADYEEGKRVPNDAVKLKLADYFGKPVEAIFFDG